MPPLRRYPAPLWLSAALAVASAPASLAQMHHVDAPERVTRAIGVYEWTGDLSKPTAARFVPVSLFIDGHFEDAGLYLARPVPFALQTGDVYSLERAGEPAGLLDLDFARHIVSGNALADDNPAGAWYGFGKFTVQTAPRVPPLHASRHPATLQTSAGPNTPAGAKLPPASSEDDGPHMSRRGASTSGSIPSTGTGSSGSSSTTPNDSSKSPSTDTSSTTAGSTTASSDDDTDRPTLRKRDPAQDAARRREYGSKGKATSGVTAAGPALGDDPDRPTLTRGSTEDAGTPELSGLPPDLHQAVAVSDATHSDAHVFARDWDSPAERTETLAALAALAKPAVAAYLTANHLIPSAAPIPPAGMNQAAGSHAAGNQAATGQATASVPANVPASSEPGAPPKLERGVPQQYRHPSASSAAQAPTAAVPTIAAKSTAATTAAAASRTTAASSTTRRPGHPVTRSNTAHAVPLTLAQQEISGFTLSYGGLPTFVYTAAAAAAPGLGSPVGTANQVAFVTVVAQRLPTGELQVALNNVTDSAHLDRGPRLRLIDAVDPDDSHRASLLFELRGSNSRQFALYRLTAVHAEQTFTTASIE